MRTKQEIQAVIDESAIKSHEAQAGMDIGFSGGVDRASNGCLETSTELSGSGNGSGMTLRTRKTHERTT